MDIWQLQEAKSKLSQLIREVVQHGPQAISIRGEVQVVMINKTEFDKLKQKQPSLISFMQKSPLKGLKLDSKRQKSKFRSIDL